MNCKGANALKHDKTMATTFNKVACGLINKNRNVTVVLDWISAAIPAK